MSYVISRCYLGPDQDTDQPVDGNTIEVWNRPAHTNLTNEERIEGWCGTTDDWSLSAHGAYATRAEAEAALHRLWQEDGGVRECDSEGVPFVDEHDPDVVAVFKPGRYAPPSVEATGNWLADNVRSDITADTTDSVLEALAADYEAAANDNGSTLSGVDAMLARRRDELRLEPEAAADTGRVAPPTPKAITHAVLANIGAYPSVNAALDEIRERMTAAGCEPVDTWTDYFAMGTTREVIEAFGHLHSSCPSDFADGYLFFADSLGSDLPPAVWVTNLDAWKAGF